MQQERMEKKKKKKKRGKEEIRASCSLVVPSQLAPDSPRWYDVSFLKHAAAVSQDLQNQEEVGEEDETEQANSSLDPS